VWQQAASHRPDTSTLASASRRSSSLCREEYGVPTFTSWVCPTAGMVVEGMRVAVSGERGQDEVLIECGALPAWQFDP